MGGQQELDKFARLFMVPGMGHCGGGPSPNTSELLLQMVKHVDHLDWVGASWLGPKAPRN